MEQGKCPKFGGGNSVSSKLIELRCLCQVSKGMLECTIAPYKNLDPGAV